MRSLMSCELISGWSARATSTVSILGESACRPSRSDETWPASGSGLRTTVTGKARTASSMRSAWWKSTTTSSSTPAPESAISWRRISGTPPSSSRLLGRLPMREPEPAASKTAPTTSRLYRPPPPLRMQPMSVSAAGIFSRSSRFDRYRCGFFLCAAATTATARCSFNRGGGLGGHERDFWALGLSDRHTAASRSDHGGENRQGNFFWRVRTDGLTSGRDDAGHAVGIFTRRNQALAQHTGLSLAGHEPEVAGRQGQRCLQALQVAAALGGHHRVAAAAQLLTHAGGIVAVQYAGGVRVVAALCAFGHQSHAQANAGRQPRQRPRHRRITEHGELGGGQHGVDEELQCAARMAGHAELQHVAQRALGGLVGRGDADALWLAAGQRLAHGFHHGGLGAAAADPAVDLAVGGDERLVAGLGWSGRL